MNYYHRGNKISQPPHLYNENLFSKKDGLYIETEPSILGRMMQPSSWGHNFSNSSLQWHHNGHNGISNHQPHDCLLNRLFRRRSKKISKLRVTGLCVGNSPVTSEFPAQIASNAENVSIWWCHHDNLTGTRKRAVKITSCFKANTGVTISLHSGLVPNIKQAINS